MTSNRTWIAGAVIGVVLIGLAGCNTKSGSMGGTGSAAAGGSSGSSATAASVTPLSAIGGGLPDPTFNGTGHVTFTVPPRYSDGTYDTGVMSIPVGGKNGASSPITLLSQSRSNQASTYHITVSRWTAAGLPDTTFGDQAGTNFTIRPSSQTGLGTLGSAWGDFGSALTMDAATGNMQVTGTTAGSNNNNLYEGTLWGITADGHLNTAGFDSPLGYLALPESVEWEWTTAVQDASGNIVVAGLIGNNLAIGRFTPQGGFDGTFLSGHVGTLYDQGIAISFPSGNPIQGVASPSQNTATSLTIDSAGRILILGRWNTTDWNDDGYFVARLNPDGTPDHTFGTSGPLVNSSGSYYTVSTGYQSGYFDEGGSSLVVDGTHVYVAGERRNSTPSNMAIWRLGNGTRDGAPDVSFASSGVFMTSASLGFPGGSGEWASSMVMDSQHRLVVGGGASTANFAFAPVLWRFAIAGNTLSADASFGSQGIVRPAAAGGSIAHVAIDPGSQAIVATGYDGSKAGIWRFVDVLPQGELTATAGVGHQVVLNWGPTPGVDGYQVYRSTTRGAGVQGTLIATGLQGTTFTDTTGLGGVPNYYVVASVTNAVTSPASNEVAATPSHNPVWTAVAAGNKYTIAIDADNTLWGWGTNIVNSTSPIQLSSATNWTKVAAGGFQFLALDANGNVWGMGDNSFGALGQGDVNPHAGLIQIGIGVPGFDHITDIASGQHFALALSTSFNSRFAWGDNSSGQLGPDCTVGIQVLLPTACDLRASRGPAGASWTSVSAGSSSNFSYGMYVDMVASGSNSTGQLGAGNTVDGTYLYAFNGAQPGDLTVSAGALHGIGMTAFFNAVYTWGNSGGGVLGLPGLRPNTHVLTATQVSLPSQPAQGLKSVVAGRSSSFVVGKAGELYGTGNNADGEQGVGADPVQNNEFDSFHTIGGSVWSSVAAGWYHVAAIQKDGSLWTWGSNLGSELGFAPGTPGLSTCSEGSAGPGPCALSPIRVP